MADEVTQADTPGQEDAEVAHERREPLWQGRPKPARVRILLSVIVLLVVAAMPVAFEEQFLSVTAGQATATVVLVQASQPGNDAPGAFRYVVALADNSKNMFVCEKLLYPGDKLIVTVSRGRITGRVWLGAPWRVGVATGS